MSDAERKESIKEELHETAQQVKEMGGWKGFKSGTWLFRIVGQSFKNYWERANVEDFKTKYASKDADFISDRLITTAAKNSGLLGVVTGALVSTDEIVALMTGGEGGIGLPANVALAGTVMASEAVVLVRIQLQMVANLGKLYGMPLDPEDPEDILTILAFAVGGSVAEEAGRFGMKIGSRVAGRLVKQAISKETLEMLKRVGAKIGIKVLQRTIVKYTVPLASVGIGMGWNYLSTRAVGKIAVSHFKSCKRELESTQQIPTRS